MASKKISVDQIRSLLSKIKLPSKWKIRSRSSEAVDESGPKELNESQPNINPEKQSVEPQPNTSQSKENNPNNEPIESPPAEEDSESDEPIDPTVMVVYYSSVFQPFYGTPGETYRLSGFHHAPRIEDYLENDAFLSQTNVIKKLIIDASNNQYHLKSVKLNVQFEQLVHFEARFIHFEQYQFLSSPKIHTIFLDAVSFDASTAFEKPTNEFTSYEAPFLLLPKGQVKAFSSCDYLNWRFFYYVQTKKILDQVESFDRLHLNVIDGRFHVHDTLFFLSRKSKFRKLKKVNLYIGQNLAEFQRYLNNYRDEFESACASFVVRKGTLQLFGIPIACYTELRPVIEFIEELFRLLKLYNLVEINPTFLYFALGTKACSLMAKLRSKTRLSYRYLMQRFYSRVEVLQCTDIKRPKIFVNFQNVWGVSIKLRKRYFINAAVKNLHQRRFLRQFRNCPAIHSLVVSGDRLVAIDNRFLDRLPDIFRNLHSLSIATETKIDFDFIFKFPHLSTLNLLLAAHPIAVATFFDLIRRLSRLMYLLVETETEVSDDRNSLHEFKLEVDVFLQELGRCDLEFSYRFSMGDHYLQRIVKPTSETEKIKIEVSEGLKEPKSATL